ncbi:pentapeptide repeat-containing protein [Rhodococcus sp. ARC_M6]|uniref:pentapeptide repeat-containing protein n=1 Tax=Rhodococcus sp. ARC_M6 TaxID=2928852 RepID=UPI001FB1C89F|nr:pentapeptide repeat-containing protein [Rhodococcus sp. ARC_M6]MCJ0904468.1 pentapeptide repeat-containing protein [Rhodococcus sp. ARC_M6]
MFAAFKIVKQLHEMLWYLAEACERAYAPEAVHEARELESAIAALTHGSLAELFSVDIGALHGAVRTVLMEVSEEVRASYFAEAGHLDPSFTPAADLAGADLRARRLCGADLRGACLIAADLRESDLAAVDLLGADLRDARLEGADLSAALYVTQPQINAARGDGKTRLPASVSAPSHWFDH